MLTHTPKPHIGIQAARSSFIVHKCWSHSALRDLQPGMVGGGTSNYRYDGGGEFLIEQKVNFEQ